MAAILRVKDENGNIVSIPAIKGDKGEKGDRGLPGSGGVPDGGTTGQVLTKNSNSDGDAGWSTPEPFVINSAEHYNQLFVNKSYAEIKEAYELGKNVVIIWNNKQYPLSSINDEKVEFIVEESITNSDDYTMYNIHTRTLAIYSESGKRATKDYVNLNVYSINGCDKSFAPKASAVLTTEQTLTTEQQSQVLTNIGGLSKNQGIDNSGKFLGIGDDGIVVPTEVGGGDKWELIAHSDTPIENVNALKINLDDNGNAFQLKKAVLYLWCSVNGSFAYANIGKASGYSWLCTINGSGQEKLYTVKYFKDVDGQWCVGANMVSYNTTTMLPTSQEAFRYGRRVTDTTEYCDYIHFEKGSGASFAKYALYGVRK